MSLYGVYVALEVCAFAVAWQCVIWEIRRRKLPRLAFQLLHHVAISLACAFTLACRYRELLGVLTLQLPPIPGGASRSSSSSSSSWESAQSAAALINADFAAYFIVDALNSATCIPRFTRADWVHHTLGLCFALSGFALEPANSLLGIMMGVQELSSIFLTLIYMGCKQQAVVRISFIVTFISTRLVLGLFAGLMRVMQHAACTAHAAAAPGCSPWSLIVTLFTWLQLGINVYFTSLIIRKARAS